MIINGNCEWTNELIALAWKQADAVNRWQILDAAGVVICCLFVCCWPGGSFCSVEGAVGPTVRRALKVAGSDRPNHRHVLSRQPRRQRLPETNVSVRYHSQNNAASSTRWWSQRWSVNVQMSTITAALYYGPLWIFSLGVVGQNFEVPLCILQRTVKTSG